MSERTNKWIGQRTIRPDGADKVTGRAAFAADTQMAGMIWGKVLRSPHPHANIRGIDTSKAAALPGTDHTLLLTDVSGGFAAGKMTGVMGLSGSGKTTLLTALTGQRRYGTRAGTVLGTNVPPGRTLRDMVAYMSADDLFFDGLTLGEMVMYKVLMQGHDGEAGAARYREVMSELDLLEHPIGRKPLRDPIEVTKTLACADDLSHERHRLARHPLTEEDMRMDPSVRDRDLLPFERGQHERIV